MKVVVKLHNQQKSSHRDVKRVPYLFLTYLEHYSQHPDSRLRSLIFYDTLPVTFSALIGQSLLCDKICFTVLPSLAHLQQNLLRFCLRLNQSDYSTIHYHKHIE